LLGASIRFENMELAADSVLHVAEVYPNSPAANAGLQATTDFILGSTDGPFIDLEDLSQQLQANTSLKIMVYSLHDDKVREVVVEPNESWGGKGRLGCDLADGALHKIDLHKKQSQKSTSGTEEEVPEES
jgi:hypothetical protein